MAWVSGFRGIYCWIFSTRESVQQSPLMAAVSREDLGACREDMEAGTPAELVHACVTGVQACTAAG